MIFIFGILRKQFKTKWTYHFSAYQSTIFFPFLCIAFNFSLALHLNSQLVKVLRIRKGYINWSSEKQFQSMEKNYFFVYSRNVIIAIPKVPIKKIQMPQFSNLRFLSAMNSFVDVPVSKIFLIYDYP